MIFVTIGERMRNYEILNIDRHNYLVIVLSVENLGDYLQSLREDVSKLKGDVRGLYLDFLLRNGISNRFFKVRVRNHTFDDVSITHCLVSRQIRDISDTYFSRHSQYLSKSVMPSYQKAEYIEQISKFL